MKDKIKPDWAGEGLLSQFVNLLIQTKPIYNLMKQPVTVASDPRHRTIISSKPN